jgi:hypothetical protein
MHGAVQSTKHENPLIDGSMPRLTTSRCHAIQFIDRRRDPPPSFKSRRVAFILNPLAARRRKSGLGGGSGVVALSETHE